MSKPLQQPRVIRTAHDANGLAVFAPDTQPPSFSPFGPDKSSFTIFDARAAIPVDNTDPTPSFENKLPRCPPRGALFTLSDIKAGCVATMHRTLSLDYCVVLSGEIVLRLDGGEEKTAREGDVIIQQGSNHQWMNQTGETCRLLFVMLGADSIVTGAGEVLEDTVFK
jgi:quercetin dioxygenase-like cupin family protein